MRDIFYDAFVDECEKIAFRRVKVKRTIFGKENPSGKRGTMTTTQLKGGPSVAPSPKRQKAFEDLPKAPVPGLKGPFAS